MRRGKVYGISLGPGDPDLITMKGYKLLQFVDKIYYPGSIFQGGRKSSYSLQIMENYDLPQDKLVGFYLEMTIDRVHVHPVYEETFQKIKKDVLEGLDVAIVCEGDLSTYSSFSYLLEKFQQTDISISLVPGISSFHLGAAEIQQPLALLGETIHVLPILKSTKVLEDALKVSDTVVLMKIRSVMGHIQPILERGDINFTYCEKLGTAEQFITSSIDKVQERTIPYFSLLIIKKNKQA
ncbi:precorrin-2 C(20)-methyltransferase [Flammeovirga agarivorans]|uniref:Precorrin-2 C(20)-methyltransferase n=1 Tax=Flammeovirga agarivorans TaxID=2726742 RepID=A0A7X8XX77_9BACT|nr:precorrin-2 C(20)-methyltransferase [Flammeovirga agarivorans]NLR92987.1 precorrin-2 C(20)-methyltransferase [Flammeovirga agarivorans]